MNSAKIVWTGEGLDFQGALSSGYELDVCGGSKKTGAGPMDLILAGVAGCTAIDVVMILQKQRQDVTGVEVEASGIRADEHPKVYTVVTLNYTIRGKDIDPTAVERAIRLSEEKYCSASAMIVSSGARMETTFQIEEEAQ